MSGRTTPVNNQQGQDTVLEKDLSLFDKIKNVPKDVYDLATGENAKVEFPNAPETTEIEDIDFFDRLIPEVKLMFTANDAGKAEIIANSFKDDERFGGAFSDKYGNPLILWNNVPHYVNKPGFSSQDLGTFVGTLLEYYPASKQSWYKGADVDVLGKSCVNSKPLCLVSCPERKPDWPSRALSSSLSTRLLELPSS